MLDDRRYMQYERICSLDPYVSCISSQDGFVVTGSRFGTLALIRDDEPLIFHLHKGAVCALQAKKCRKFSFSNCLYVICGTSLGFIYVHLVHLDNIAASRIIYKYRTDSPVIGISLNPEYNVHNLEGRVKRRSYDLRSYLSEGVAWNNVKRNEHSDESFIFALSMGVICLLCMGINRGFDDISVAILSPLDKNCKVVSFSWCGDMVAWSDYDGIQIFLLRNRLPVAFVPYVLSLNFNQEDRSVARSDDGTVSLSQLLMDNEYCCTSDESSDISTLSDDLECIPMGNVKLNQAFRSHMIHERCKDAVCDANEHAEVKLCWIDKKNILIGYKNIVQCVNIISSSNRGCYNRETYSLAENKVKLLGATNFRCLATGIKSNPQFSNLNALTMNRNPPLRGYISYSFESPSTHFVVGLKRHGSGKVFSIIYLILNSCDDKNPHPENSNEDFRFKSAFIREKEFGQPESVSNFTDIQKGEEEAVLSFFSFDNCFRCTTINESFVQCTYVDEKMKFESKYLLHFICSINKNGFDVIWKQNFSIYSLLCLDYKNYDHCFSVFDDRSIKNKLSYRSKKLCDYYYNECYKENSTSGGFFGANRHSMGVLTCSSDDTNFGKIYIGYRGFLMSISDCTLKQYISQFIRHGMFNLAFSEIFQNREYLFKVESNFYGYIYDVFSRGIDELLSNNYVDVKQIVKMTLAFIKCCEGFVTEHYRIDLLRNVFDQFHKHNKINVLISYVFPSNLCPYLLNDDICHYVIENVFKSTDGNIRFFVMLRIISCWSLDVVHVRRLLYILKEGILKHVSSLNLNGDLSMCNCLLDKEFIPSDSLTSWGSDFHVKCDILKIIIYECSKLDVSMLDLKVDSNNFLWGVYNDFELIERLSQKHKESILETLKSSPLDPNTEAGLLAMGLLLFKTGNYEESFTFLLYSRYPLVTFVARMICDSGVHIDKVMYHGLALYSIDAEKTNSIFLDVFTGSLDIIERAIDILKSNLQFLFMFLDSMYINDILPLKLYPLYFEHLCLLKPNSASCFIRDSQAIFERNSTELHLCFEVIIDIIHKFTIKGRYKLMDDYFQILSSLYMAEAHLRLLLCHSLSTVFKILLLALQLRYDSDVYRKNKPTASRLMLEGITIMLSQISTNRVPSEISYELLKSQFFSKGADINERSVPFGHNTARTMLEIISLCGDLSFEEFQAKMSTLSFFTQDLLRYKGFGIHVVTMHNNNDEVIVKRKNNVNSVCILCDSAFINDPMIKRESLFIIKTLTSRIDAYVQPLDYPKVPKMLCFFCGHLSHEFCQIRLINYAISLSNSFRYPNGHTSSMDGLERLCLLCLKNEDS